MSQMSQSWMGWEDLIEAGSGLCPSAMWPQGSRFSGLGLSVLLCPVSDCLDMLWPPLWFWLSPTLWEEKRWRHMGQYGGERKFYLGRGTFKVNYLEVEWTIVHQSIKNRNTEVEKKWLGVSCNHSEQQCCTYQESRLLKPNQEMDFLEARTTLCLTHFAVLLPGTYAPIYKL